MSNDSMGFVGVITFLATYGYCISHYGLLFGVGLGWLPSFILAVTWPVSLPIVAIVAVVG